MAKAWPCYATNALVLIAASACGADPAASDSPVAASPSTAETADTAKSPAGDSPYKPGSQQDVAPDAAEAVWAAIPSEMRPKTLLPAMKTKLLMPDVKRHGVAMFTDVVTIAPGEDVTFCTYTNVITSETTYIHDTAGSQTNFGHHAIMQYTTDVSDPGTRKCEQDSLEAQQGQVLGGTGGEGTGAIQLPSNVVSEVPAGAQFIINHHWINTGDEPIEAQAEMITVPPDSEDNLVIARGLTLVATQFMVPAQGQIDHTVTCMFDRDASMISLLGHEHAWGTHVKAERVGGTGEVLFDHDYDESMISHPLNTYYPVGAPYHIASGDGVRMTCSWNNTTDHPLTFPREMCVTFGWQIGAEQDTSCLDGVWRR